MCNRCESGRAGVSKDREAGNGVIGEVKRLPGYEQGPDFEQPGSESLIVTLPTMRLSLQLEGSKPRQHVSLPID